MWRSASATELPVSCSNMGDVPEDLPNVDGTAADLVFLRGIDRVATRHALEERCGLLTVVAGRINGTETLTFAAYAPGAENTTAWLKAELEEDAGGVRAVRRDRIVMGDEVF